MSKRILALSLILVMVISLVACGNKKDNNNDGNNSSQTEPIEVIEPTESFMTDDGDERTTVFNIAEDDKAQPTTIKFNFNKPSNIALSFVQALATNQYNVALSILDIDNSPFVTSDDIVFGLQNSQYTKIFENAGKEVYAVVEKGDSSKVIDKASAIVKLMDIDNNEIASYNVSLVLNEENKWVVMDKSFYVEDFYISIPGNTKASINGEELTEKYSDGNRGHSDLMDRYKLPAIGRSFKECVIECDSFLMKHSFFATSNIKDEPLNLNKNLDGDELTNALTAVKDLWNGLYKEYNKGTKSTELNNYFTNNVDETIRAKIYEGFDKLTKGSSGYKDINHEITKIEKRNDANCFYITDEVIVMNIQYQLDWEWTFALGGPENCRQISHILIAKTDDGYKIHEVSDMGLFSKNDGKDW